jgi:hypothetical protein
VAAHSRVQATTPTSKQTTAMPGGAPVPCWPCRVRSRSSPGCR